MPGLSTTTPGVHAPMGFTESVDCGAIQVKAEAPFLQGQPGHFVIVEAQKPVRVIVSGAVIVCDGSVHHSQLPSLFQVSDVNTGEIRWNNADEVSNVIWSVNGKLMLLLKKTL